MKLEIFQWRSMNYKTCAVRFSQFYWVDLCEFLEEGDELGWEVGMKSSYVVQANTCSFKDTCIM